MRKNENVCLGIGIVCAIFMIAGWVVTLMELGPIPIPFGVSPWIVLFAASFGRGMMIASIVVCGILYFGLMAGLWFSAKGKALGAAASSVILCFDLVLSGFLAAMVTKWFLVAFVLDAGMIGLNCSAFLRIALKE